MNLLLVWSDVIRLGGGGREGGAAIGRDSRKTVSSSSGKGCILLSPRPSGPSLVLLLMEKSLESLEPPAASESMEELPSTAKVLLPSSSQGGRIGEVSFSMLTLLLAVAHGLPSLSRSPSVRVLKKLKRPPSSLIYLASGRLPHAPAILQLAQMTSSQMPSAGLKCLQLVSDAFSWSQMPSAGLLELSKILNFPCHPITRGGSLGTKSLQFISLFLVVNCGRKPIVANHLTSLWLFSAQ